MDLNRYLPDLRQSGLLIVAAFYGALIVVNIATLVPGPQNVLDAINSNPLAPVLSIIVFDTPWSLTGLAGLVMLFGAIVFSTPVAERRRLSVFFVCCSILTGIVSGAIWDSYYDTTGFVGAGVSAIAIAGQGVVFTLSFFGILRLAREKTRRLGRMSDYWWKSFMLIYATMILSTVWFVGFGQSIFVPTLLYNWRVHEIAFFISIGATSLYEGLRWKPQGLDGSIPVDEMLANFRFDDLNDRFQGALPKLKVVFKGLAKGEPAAFDPPTSEVLLDAGFRGRDYRLVGKEFDAALLHGMVHAYLYQEGVAWQHGDPAAKERFDSVAAKVGAQPEG